MEHKIVEGQSGAFGNSILHKSESSTNIDRPMEKTEQEVPKELTEYEIGMKVWIIPEGEEPQEVYEKIALWAKKRSDTYWKYILEQEIRNAIVLGSGSRDVEGYINERKAKFGIK